MSDPHTAQSRTPKKRPCRLSAGDFAGSPCRERSRDVKHAVPRLNRRSASRSPLAERPFEEWLTWFRSLKSVQPWFFWYRPCKNRGWNPPCAASEPSSDSSHRPAFARLVAWEWTSSSTWFRWIYGIDRLAQCRAVHLLDPRMLRGLFKSVLQTRRSMGLP